MIKHKCFISFKTSDMYYKKSIQNLLGDRIIDKSLNEPIDSDDEKYVMQKIRDDHLKDSSVTLFLIGENSSESCLEALFNKQMYIKKELSASLYKSSGKGRNGIVGIVLPEMYSKIYNGKHKCDMCGNDHNIVFIDDNTVIKEFSANYYIEELQGDCGAWSEKDRYCVLVKYDDFISDSDTYIDKAFEKKSDERLLKHIKVFPK